MTATVSVGAGNPDGVTVTPDGAQVYVANNAGGTISVIGTGTNTVIATVPVGGSNNLHGVAVTPDGTRVYAADGGPAVFVISTATNTVSATVPLPGRTAYGIAVTADGSRVYVTDTSGNALVAISTATNTVIAAVPVGTLPFGVAITPSAGPPPPLAITTVSPLPGSTVGAAYSQTFAASGGAPPYSSWTLIAGTLPPGLTLNSGTAALTGTPTTAGTFNFTVQVSDSAAGVASKSFVLTVSAVAVAGQTIPTLSEWSVLLLSALLAVAAAARLRRR